MKERRKYGKREGKKVVSKGVWKERRKYGNK